MDISTSKIYQYLIQNGMTERASQKKMMNIVNEKIARNEGPILIEAPTGTGKSLGYLIPVVEHGKKAIISTKTKILQEQLRKDLQFLSSVTQKVYDRPVNFMILKGKSNYLCLDRLENILNTFKEDSQMDFTTGEKTCNIYEKDKMFYETIENYVQENPDWDGDVEFINIPMNIWSQVNIDEDYCDSAYRSTCPHRDKCYFYKTVKEKEKKADIIVINHSLLALKQANRKKRNNEQENENNENQKEKPVLIIDEAHELDDALVQSLTDSISSVSLSRMISTILNLLPENEKKNCELSKISVNQMYEELFGKILGKASSAVLEDKTFLPAFNNLFNLMFDEFKKVLSHAKSDIHDKIMRAKPEERALYEYVIENLFDLDILTQNDPVASAVRPLGMNDIESDTAKDIRITVNRLRMLKSKLMSFREKLVLIDAINEDGKLEYGMCIRKEQSRMVINQYNYYLDVFPIFAKDVIKTDEHATVILTSATLDKELVELTTGIKGTYHTLDYTFDYSNVKFVVKSVSPRQDENLWKKEIVKSYEKLMQTYNKNLILLTSKDQESLIPKSNDVVFQHEVPLKQAIDMLEKGEKRALVGLDSLWTGVSIKGEKGILMAKLPFESPSEPVNYFRNKYFEMHKMDKYEYSKRRALMHFKQGFGRLVRTHGDCGTVVMCDNRIFKYKEFIRFLKELGVQIYYNDTLLKV